MRLTLSYLAIIMLLSIGFSFLLYSVSLAELSRSANRPLPYYFYQHNLNDLRQQDLTVGETNVKRNLLLINLVTVVLGGGASYWLARRTLKPLESAMTAQSRFASDASHELRTPLTAMQTEIEVALRDKRLSLIEARELLESNLEEVGKLRALSEGLLQLSREENKQVLTDPVDMTEVARQAVERYALAAKQRRITVESQLEPAVARGDSVSLLELLAVLIDNAIKYSPRGSKIIITTNQTKSHAVVSVRDEGQGIEAEHLTHIFDRFYRAESSRSKQQTSGYGLGLSLAKHITDAHGGSIDVSTIPGKGSTFRVSLPLG